LRLVLLALQVGTPPPLHARQIGGKPLKARDLWDPSWQRSQGISGDQYSWGIRGWSRLRDSAPWVVRVHPRVNRWRKSIFQRQEL